MSHESFLKSESGVKQMFDDGLTIQQVALKTGWSVNTVTKLATKTLDKLKRIEEAKSEYRRLFVNQYTPLLATARKTIDNYQAPVKCSELVECPDEYIKSLESPIVFETALAHLTNTVDALKADLAWFNYRTKGTL